MCDPVSIGYGVAGLVGGALVSKAITPSQPSVQAPSAPVAPPTPAAQAGKAPNVKAMRSANAGAGTGVNAGIASTLLTGPAGVDPATLELKKQTLLGSNTLLGG